MRPGSDSPTTLVLIRHGESNVTVNRVIGGHRTCSGLSGLGRRQAERLRDRLLTTGELVPDVLISSNFARAIETAEVIAPAFGDVPVEIMAGFGEHDPGPDIDGMTFAAYVEKFGSPDWLDPHDEIFPGGETIAAFHDRVIATVDRVVDSYRGCTVVVSCHGGVIDAVFRNLLGTASTGVFELAAANTSITGFSSLATGGWRLTRYNDRAHLEGLPEMTPRAQDAVD